MDFSTRTNLIWKEKNWKAFKAAIKSFVLYMRNFQSFSIKKLSTQIWLETTFTALNKSAIIRQKYENFFHRASS